MERYLIILALILSLIGGAILAKGGFFTSGEKAYEQGDFATASMKLKSSKSAKAQYYMGTMYLNGQGLQRDKAAAANWYLKAAEQGYSEAQFSLGVMLATGDGIPQDKPAAAEWYRKAANQGSDKAQFNLGIMLGTGDGVRQDKGEALTWIKKSADMGNERAQQALINLTKPPKQGN